MDGNMANRHYASTVKDTMTKSHGPCASRICSPTGTMKYNLNTKALAAEILMKAHNWDCQPFGASYLQFICRRPVLTGVTNWKDCDSQHFPKLFFEDNIACAFSDSKVTDSIAVSESYSTVIAVELSEPNQEERKDVIADVETTDTPAQVSMEVLNPNSVVNKMYIAEAETSSAACTEVPTELLGSTSKEDETEITAVSRTETCYCDVEASTKASHSSSSDEDNETDVATTREAVTCFAKVSELKDLSSDDGRNEIRSVSEEDTCRDGLKAFMELLDPTVKENESDDITSTESGTCSNLEVIPSQSTGDSENAETDEEAVREDETHCDEESELQDLSGEDGMKEIIAFSAETVTCCACLEASSELLVSTNKKEPVYITVAEWEPPCHEMSFEVSDANSNDEEKGTDDSQIASSGSLPSDIVSDSDVEIQKDLCDVAHIAKPTLQESFEADFNVRDSGSQVPKELPEFQDESNLNRSKYSYHQNEPAGHCSSKASESFMMTVTQECHQVPAFGLPQHFLSNHLPQESSCSLRPQTALPDAFLAIRIDCPAIVNSLGHFQKHLMSVKGGRCQDAFTPLSKLHITLMTMKLGRDPETIYRASLALQEASNKLYSWLHAGEYLHKIPALQIKVQGIDCIKNKLLVAKIKEQNFPVHSFLAGVADVLKATFAEFGISSLDTRPFQYQVVIAKANKIRRKVGSRAISFHENDYEAYTQHRHGAMVVDTIELVSTKIGTPCGKYYHTYASNKWTQLSCKLS